MLNPSQTQSMLSKLVRLERILEPKLFRPVGELALELFETTTQHHSVPGDEYPWRAVTRGDTWGGEAVYGWFRGSWAPTPDAAGRPVYLLPAVGGYEAMLWVEGRVAGTYATKIVQTGHGNHYAAQVTAAAQLDQPLHLAMEFYAGHHIIGTRPFETTPLPTFRYPVEGATLAVKEEAVASFLFDLKTMNQLAKVLDPESTRSARVIRTLREVHQVVTYAPDESDESAWRPALAEARALMAPALAVRNSVSQSFAGLVGHSHMDTAWLWTIAETVKKCARTYANQLSLMEQYPEYRFVQSSAYHGELIRRHYPELFERIRQKVAEGRYEPNGAVWVECDGNMTSGEAMVRQFVWGQRWTREHFGYTSNAFWLPDTFGYSAAIPQLMKGAGVDAFFTTKLSWNDTNRFPFETFRWAGLDGTQVVAHFNLTHVWPDAQTLYEQTRGRDRLVAYGFGDGGGGPQFEMIEMARRVADLEGIPRSEHVSVSAFADRLLAKADEFPLYEGDLYLELHRGTLTNQHPIKENNRRAEQALHDLEYLTVRRSAESGAQASGEPLKPLWETLLVNQFHDILPGTSIAAAHDQSYKDMAELLARARALIDEALPGTSDPATVSVFNTLAFDRTEVVDLGPAPGLVPVGLPWQRVPSPDGERLRVGPVTVPSLGSAIVTLNPASAEAPSAFQYDGTTLTTPFFTVAFEADGTIASLVDKRVGRELRGGGLPLNTFLMCEDVPNKWDNWDVDADSLLKTRVVGTLVDRVVAADGALEFRLRSTVRLSPRSVLRQDLVFSSWTARIDFESELDWHDTHQFLKVGFDTTVRATTARHEVQFGHTQKPTTRNTTWEQAQFEVLNHRYTDLSETRYGVAVLNDVKYGISVEGSDLRLSLHKGGTRPDPRGDAGWHRFRYALLPHVGGFSAEAVVLPGYAFGQPFLVRPGASSWSAFARVGAPNVVLETVKPCEDAARAYITRLYEAEGTWTRTVLSLSSLPLKVEQTNLLEEPHAVLPPSKEVALTLRPFEVVTLKITYGE